MTSYSLFLAEFTERRILSPSFVRLTFRAPGLEHIGRTMLDQRMKLVLGSEEHLEHLKRADDRWYAAWSDLGDDRPIVRTYTFSALAEDERGPFACIDVAIHADVSGPGSDFARYGTPGTKVGLLAADARREGHETLGVAWTPGTADDFLIIADETALPAVANIVPTLPATARGRLVIEVPEAGDVRLLDIPQRMTVEWRVRADGHSALDDLPRTTLLPCCAEETADDCTAKLWDEGLGREHYAWVAGECGWVRSIRRALRASYSREEMSVMGYWRRGGCL